MNTNNNEYKSVIITNFDKAKKSLKLNNYHYATCFLISCTENVLRQYAVNKGDMNQEDMLEIVKMKPQERPFFVDSELVKHIEQILNSKENANYTKEDFEIIFSFLMSIKTQYENDGFSFEITDSELLQVRNMLDAISYDKINELL